MTDLRVAIVHDYLTQFGGAERVAAELCKAFPGAPLYTTVYRPKQTWEDFRAMDVRCSYLQRLGPLTARHRILLPLYPRAVEHLKIEPVDVVISNSSAFAKGVHPPAGAVHVCYCHNPMRFAWRSADYLERERMPRWAKRMIERQMGSLRRWDLARNEEVDVFLANSENVRTRIREWYGRDAEVLYPPTPMPKFDPAARGQDGHLLVVSRLVGYKRVDLAIGAAERLGAQLVIVGEGPDRGRLESMSGNGVRFAGRVGDEQLEAVYAGAAALIFPGEEDFGLVPVEAMARGVPVIAFGAGGALETVIPEETGVFFEEPTAASLAAAIERCLSQPWDSARLRARAEEFSVDRFRARVHQLVADAVMSCERC